MKKKFKYEFVDLSEKNEITHEYSSEFDEKLTLKIEEGISVLYVNRSSLLYLAKLFIKLALGKYKDGFHIHFTKDCDADNPEVLRVILDDYKE